MFSAFRFKLIDQKDLIRWQSLGSYMSVQKSHKSVWDCIKVYRIVQWNCIQTLAFIPLILFLAKKRVKKGYYGNEGWSLAWDHIQVHQMPLFITIFGATQWFWPRDLWIGNPSDWNYPIFLFLVIFKKWVETRKSGNNFFLIVTDT